MSRRVWVAISAAAAPMSVSGTQCSPPQKPREEGAMPDYKWPEPAKRTLMGKRISRLDGPDKVSGKAKYTYDVKRPEMLYGKILRCPHAHARIVSIDISAAEKMPGVKAVKIIDPAGTEVHYAGWEIAAVAATEEHLAEDAARAIK